MSSKLSKTLRALVNPTTAALDKQVERSTWDCESYTNVAAVTTTNAVAEITIAVMKYPARLVAAYFLPSSGSVTAGATHYFNLLVAKRGAATPFTSANLITYAADTATTDDATQWDAKDLSAYFSATLADLSLAENDTLTVAVTKTGTNGMTFPAGTVELFFRPLDA